MKIRVSILAAIALLAGLFVGGAAFATAPANDNFASASTLTIAGNPAKAAITGSNAGATGETGEPNHAGASLASGCTNATTPNTSCENSVWYKWTATADGPFTVELCESDYDTTVGVYTATGSTVDTVHEVSSNDNGETGCPTNHTASRVTFTAVNATDYFIAVAGFQGATGTIAGALESCTTTGANCLAPVVTTGSASNITGGSATLNGTVNPEGQSTSYVFNYGTAPDALTSTTASGDAGSDSVSHSVNASITGLASGTKYYFQTEATNASGTSDGTVQSFTTNAAPTATTGAATNITGTTATLNGTVNPEGSPTQYFFQYGTASDLATSTPTGLTSAGSGTGDVTAAANIGSLSPGTTYYFRVVAQSAAGTTDGTIKNFTTLSAPSATTVAANPVTPTGATLNATINPEGQGTTYHFEYGTDTFYGTSTPDASAGSGTTNTNVSANITGLSPSTTYHFRVVASNATGTTAGGDLSFTTLAAGAKPAVSYPSANPYSATNITTSSATLNGIVNPEGAATTYQFQYGLTVAYGTNSPAAAASVGSDSLNHNVSANITGLLSGQTYHWRLIATNSHGTTNGADQTFVAKAPPTATTTAATNVVATTATLNGTVNPQGTATNYSFEYGPDTNYGTTTTPASAGSDSNTHSVHTDITGLTANTTYHYRVIADNGQSIVKGADMSLTTRSAPAAVSDPATSITSTGATLHGTVNPNGLATVYDFQYGTTTGFGSTTTSTSAGSGTSVLPESATINGLAPSTTYFFRITASNAAGTTNGDTLSFTTPTGPTATTGTATGLNPTTATLNGTVNPAGQDTQYHFEYGTDSFYGTNTSSTDAGSGTDDVPVSAAITGLTPGTTYHFRLVATNASGTSNGLDQTFTTSGSGSPTATTLAATGVSPTGATLNGTVNPQGSATTSHFEWGTTTSYGFTTPDVSVGSDSTSHAESAALTRLIPGTTYHFRIVATNTTGESDGADMSFVAASQPTVVTKAASGIDTFEATLNGSVNPQSSATTYHFEWATSTAYGNDTPDATLPADSTVHNVSAHIAGLVQGTVYHFRLVATSAGGTTNGADMTFEACGTCTDFNGDGHPDVLYWNRNNGVTITWFLGGANGLVKQGSQQTVVTDGHGYPVPTWVPVATADFTRDGHPDILYWNSNTGVLNLWVMGGSKGTTKLGSFQIKTLAGFPKTSYVPVGVADYNGDGFLDILYWNKNSGATAIWYMGGNGGISQQSSVFVTPDSHGYPVTSYVPVATSDFNGDGTPDILYRNKNNGVLIDWFMGGADGSVKQGSEQVAAGTAGFPKTYWLPVSTSDFNGDGVPDILYWQSGNGVLIDWFMGGTDGLTKEGSQFVTPDSHGFPRPVYKPIG